VEVSFWERSIFLHDGWILELPEKKSEQMGINIDEKETARKYFGHHDSLAFLSTQACV
jgi:hypothetical protein